MSQICKSKKCKKTQNAKRPENTLKFWRFIENRLWRFVALKSVENDPRIPRVIPALKFP
jgi:hypothetical protein